MFTLHILQVECIYSFRFAYCLFLSVTAAKAILLCSCSLFYPAVGLHTQIFLFAYDIALVLQQNRLRWYGHVLRKDDDDWAKKCMSVLWRCWLGGRKGIRPVKNWVVRCWHGYLSGARCRLAYGPADATVSCFSKIQIGFAFLVPAHPGSPGQRAVKRVCVCMHMYTY